MEGNKEALEQDKVLLYIEHCFMTKLVVNFTADAKSTPKLAKCVSVKHLIEFLLIVGGRTGVNKALQRQVPFFCKVFLKQGILAHLSCTRITSELN